MLVVIDFMLRNARYINEVAPGVVIVCGTYGVDDEFLLTSLANMPMEEEVGLIDGYYPLEKVLFEDEGVFLGEEVVVNRNGVILYENQSEGVSLLDFTEFLKRLKPDIREDLPDISETGLELQEGKVKAFKRVLMVAGAILGLVLLGNLFLNFERKSVDKKIEEITMNIENLKREKQALKDRYWTKIGGVRGKEIRDLVLSASFIDFIPDTFKVYVDGRGIRVEGMIYPDQLMYVWQECKKRKLSCGIEYKQMKVGEDAYVVSVSKR